MTENSGDLCAPATVPDFTCKCAVLSKAIPFASVQCASKGGFDAHFYRCIACGTEVTRLASI